MDVRSAETLVYTRLRSKWGRYWNGKEEVGRTY